MGWIGVDFDGTLATDKDGTPIPAMVERVRRWLAAGIEVRILTARVSSMSLEQEGSAVIYGHRKAIDSWCKNVFGQTLPITAEKDYSMYQLWDDRAVQVVRDTGERVGNVNRPSDKHIGKTLIDEESGFTK